MKGTVNVGVIGCGVVGTGVMNVLLDNSAVIKDKTGFDIKLAAVADLFVENKSAGSWFDKVPIKTKNAFDIIDNPDIDIVAELIGGTTHAKDFIIAAMKNGKHVVTANKALLALHGREIFRVAEENNVKIGFEASVGGGIPLINVVKEDLSANNILEISAIINGTCNYILTNMTKDKLPYKDILAKAKELGYAESDPTFDVEGIDAAHKITLLSSIAFGYWVDFDKVYKEGISRISPVDIDFASDLGCTVKLLAIAKKWKGSPAQIEVRVHPTMIPNSSMLASVNDAFNAICITSDMAGETMLYGRGAGGLPTGSAVAADIVSIARDMAANSACRVPTMGFVKEQDAVMKDIMDISSVFYLRFGAIDMPGVLSTIAGILGKHRISIRSALQRAKTDDTEFKKVPLVFLTHNTTGRQVHDAVEEIDKLEIVLDKSVIIRVSGIESRSFK